LLTQNLSDAFRKKRKKNLLQRKKVQRKKVQMRKKK
jgi:hypothetical protein